MEEIGRVRKIGIYTIVRRLPPDGKMTLVECSCGREIAISTEIFLMGVCNRCTCDYDDMLSHRRRSYRHDMALEATERTRVVGVRIAQDDAPRHRLAIRRAVRLLRKKVR